MAKNKKSPRRKGAATSSAPRLSPQAAQNALERALRAQQARDFTTAERLCKQVLRSNPLHGDALDVLGVIYLQTGAAEAAEKMLTRAVKAVPGSIQAHVNLAISKAQLGEVDGAVASYQAALRIDPQYADAHFRLGNLLADAGDPQGAIHHLERGLALQPGRRGGFNDLGIALSGAGRIEDAVVAYRKGLAADPDDSGALNNLGLALTELGDIEGAMEVFAQAVRLAPDAPSIRYNLFDALERRHRIDALRLALADADARIGAHPQFALARAHLARRDKDDAAARDALLAVDPVRDAPQIHDPNFWPKRAQMLGDIYDRLGEPHLAMAAFGENNRLMALHTMPAGVDRTAYTDRLVRLQTYFEQAEVSAWNPLNAADSRPDPVFLVGFPRSGTTLLDVVLRGHPDIASLEELPMISAVAHLLQEMPGGEPAGLADLRDDGLARLRGAYFSRLDEHLPAVARNAPVVVDKLPLNLVDAGLIQRVFPDARFILALRHPCDCVLSCYMHAFKLNSAMANFLTLEDAATLYDQAFALWETYRRVLPLKVHTVHYEDVVDDLEGTVRPLLDFLGLDWNPTVLDHVGTAQRSRINTPSYNQVVEPLYKRAQGRWTRYADDLRPVMPLLERWISRFGYA